METPLSRELTRREELTRRAFRRLPWVIGVDMSKDPRMDMDMDVDMGAYKHKHRCT